MNDDDWSDLPGYGRGVVRPRFFWDGGGGRSFFATAGATWEDRTGGTQPGAVLSATGEAYREALETSASTSAPSGQTSFAVATCSPRGLARQRHDHEFGETIERDRHATAFGRWPSVVLPDATCG